MSRHAPPPKNQPLPADVKIAIVAARFNAHIVDVLLTGCEAQLQALGVQRANITVRLVPGAYELPLAAQWLARAEEFAAIICLGCVVRGDTPHFEFVAGECARGLMRVSLDENLPVIFGVLTTNTEQQALDRAGGSHSHAGRNAADAAAEMIHLRQRVDQ